MWRGEQNALIIGTITETEGNLYQITVNHALTCGPEGAEKRDRQDASAQRNTR